tara:strand:+ start:121 stop:387 length:267 start_codon:yes stop_codon:yes gene_type:complete
MNNTKSTQTAGDILRGIAYLSADVDQVKIASEMMMRSNGRAMTAPATSEEKWNQVLLRNQRKHFLLEDLEKMISELQAIKDSVENLWS